MDLRGLVTAAADKYGIPRDVMHNLVQTESGYNPQAVSPKGAIGPTQLMPGTARDLGVDPRDPAQNIDGGARYLKAQHDRFGDWSLAAAAYNAGPARVQRAGGVPNIPETQNYVRKVAGNPMPNASDLKSYFGGSSSPAGASAPEAAAGGPPSAADLNAYYGAQASPKPSGWRPPQIASPAPTVAQDAWSGFSQPFQTLGHDVMDNVRHAASGERNPIADLMSVPKMLGDVVGLTSAPVQAAIRPAARAVNSLPIRPYTQDSPFSKPRPMYGDEAQGALEGMLNTALSGAAPAARSPIPMFGGAPPPQLAPNVRQAARYVSKIVKSAGATPESLDAAASGIPMIAAEAIGKPGEVALGALARRSGATGDELSGVISARRADRPQRVLDAFSSASGVNPAAVSDVSAEAARTIAAASQAPDVPTGMAGQAVHSRLNREFDTAKAQVNSLYDAARDATPEGARLLGEAKPKVAQNLREAVRDFDPEAVPRVARQLDNFDALKSATARDLFEMRTRLGKLRVSADPVEAEAASTAVRAIDTQMDEALQSGSFTGDTGVIQQWRDAIAARRDLGRQFEGKDLIQDLTKRTYRGGERTNAVAPEDASSAIFGRTGVTAKPNAVRDLTRLRDRFGADSPEWRAVQDEGFSRVLGRDAGSEEFGRSWDQFSTRSPDLANLLLSDQGRATLASSRAAIGQATRSRDAFQGGADLFNANVNERQFGHRLSDLAEPARQALRSGVANRLYNMSQSGKLNPNALTVPHVRAKLAVLFGDEGASRIITAAQQEAKMAGFEQRYGPGTNSVTAELSAAMAEQDAGGPIGQMAGDFLTGIPTRGAKGAAMGAVARQLGNLSAGLKTAGLNGGARDEAGRLLMLPPQDLAAALRAANAPRRLLPPVRDVVGAGAVAAPLARQPAPPKKRVPSR